MVTQVNNHTELLCEIDPMGLTKHGAPQDEYEPEATSILALLEKEHFTPASLRSVFVFWFSENTCPWKTDDDSQLIQLYNDIRLSYESSVRHPALT